MVCSFWQTQDIEEKKERDKESKQKDHMTKTNREPEEEARKSMKEQHFSG